jgi:hypothetical protein
MYFSVKLSLIGFFFFFFFWLSLSKIVNKPYNIKLKNYSVHARSTYRMRTKKMMSLNELAKLCYNPILFSIKNSLFLSSYFTPLSSLFTLFLYPLFLSLHSFKPYYYYYYYLRPIIYWFIFIFLYLSYSLIQNEWVSFALTFFFLRHHHHRNLVFQFDLKKIDFISIYIQRF